MSTVIPPWQVEPILRDADYEPVREAMQAYTLGRDASTADTLWLIEHKPIFTLGLAGKEEHLLHSSNIPVVRTERGGQITYHGPGQIVVYVLVDLRRRNLLVRELVTAIEDAVIDTLASYGLAGERKDGAPGVYLRDVPGSPPQELCKVAALGLKVTHGCSWHGVALNVAMDLHPYDLINPCGYAGLRTIDLRTMGVTTTVDQAAQVLVAALQRRVDAASKPTP